MSAFANRSELINRATGGNSGNPQRIWRFVDNRVDTGAAAANVAGQKTSLWQYNGSISDGAMPGGTPRTCDNTTAGGFKQTDPSGGRELWLTGLVAYSSVPGVLILLDRLTDVSGLSGTNASAQTFTLSAPRYTNGLGNQIWIEIPTAIGSTNTTYTCSYTNQAGSSGQTSRATSIGGTGLNNAQRVIVTDLAQGDNGVQAVANFDLLASTGTAGDICVALVHPLLNIPLAGIGAGGIYSCVMQGDIVKIETGACLSLAWHSQSTTVPRIDCLLTMCER